MFVFPLIMLFLCFPNNGIHNLYHWWFFYPFTLLLSPNLILLHAIIHSNSPRIFATLPLCNKTFFHHLKLLLLHYDTYPYTPLCTITHTHTTHHHLHPTEQTWADPCCIPAHHPMPVWQKVSCCPPASPCCPRHWATCVQCWCPPPSSLSPGTCHSCPPSTPPPATPSSGGRLVRRGKWINTQQVWGTLLRLKHFSK